MNPDAAAIGHPFNDGYPMYSPCVAAEKPVRQMVYGSGANQYVDGPTGIIRIPTMSNCSSCLKNWGVVSHGTQGGLSQAGVTLIFEGTPGELYFREGPMDRSTADVQPGDSGGLVAWNQTRDVVGLVTGGLGTSYTDYTRADYVKTAFFRAGVSFDHYWGISGGISNSTYPVYRPSYPPPPGSQFSIDPPDPSPCSF